MVIISAMRCFCASVSLERLRIINSSCPGITFVSIADSGSSAHFDSFVRFFRCGFFFNIIQSFIDAAGMPVSLPKSRVVISFSASLIICS